jgi:hypothetical protein
MPDKFIQTFTGKRIYLDNPQPEDICLMDIAHSLSMTCRFNGHPKLFYSNAEHSVLVYQIAGTRESLMHDAHEAYVGDPWKPLARFLGEKYFALKLAFDVAICDKYGLDLATMRVGNTKDADRTALAIEAKHLMGDTTGWEIDGICTGVKLPVSCWPQQLAKEKFLRACYEAGIYD